MRKVLSAMVLAAVAAACGGKQKPAAEPAPAAENKIVVAQPAAVPEPAPPEPEPEPPPALVAESTGSPACDAYLASIDRLAVVCAAKLPPQSMEAMLAGRDAMLVAFHQWHDLDPASRQATIDAASDGCKAAVDAIEQAAAAMACPLK